MSLAAGSSSVGGVGGSVGPPGGAAQRWLASVEVEFVDADGLGGGGGAGVRRELLIRCWDGAFERVAPVREFASYRGQRNWPGLWWFSATGEHVGYESWVERDRLMAMDADPEVVGVAAQPMWLHWADAKTGRAVRHAPDFFVRRADGTGVVVDVRPDQRIGHGDAAVFAATGRICASVGWDYQRVGELDPVRAANLRWLAGYRHPRCLRAGLAVALREVFAEAGPNGMPLLAGARTVGDRVAVLPVLFAMLWRGELGCELGEAVLAPSTIVWAAGQVPDVRPGGGWGW